MKYKHKIINAGFFFYYYYVDENACARFSRRNYFEIMAVANRLGQVKYNNVIITYQISGNA